MVVDGLKIPEQLLSMLETGRWPRTEADTTQQNLRSRASADRIRALAPEESHLYLYAPPFRTVARIVVGNPFYAEFGGLDHIVPEAAIEIGDFGLGSDAPIILDYRTIPDNPRLLRLRWPGGGQPNEWVMMARDFRSFVEALGL